VKLNGCCRSMRRWNRWIHPSIQGMLVSRDRVVWSSQYTNEPDPSNRGGFIAVVRGAYISVPLRRRVSPSASAICRVNPE
jgi:hypothetical protein